ncbi:helix-turn-helix domain-containing protein [Pseudomonas syringae]|uniref:helix-turn-helix domain-containing protein n=1 Tax=Pseudomonas TaxID=286 RepID=UPI00088A7C5A|nr:MULTISPECIES: helix-turn-helix domain-containing protein [Pseudomonas]NAP01969.1 GntR family transcriptional regulator [Pseudomonas syringae]NAP22492.1 GntR family transcriptional regulator [Pseudomonas syringae]NAP48561.1 GntR family transcriptional regulator [Pseudomonas syringae]NAP82547.1 GntR family transcriptional regulator [Pseudomonas syringae]NAQ13493.1 GntR family transcriptional regulator [Pseudomonas syringae]
MSMELMVKAMKTRVGNPLRKLVLIKLADNANDMGECWPSYQHIADQCEIDRSTVRRHIKNLEEQRLLRIENRDGPKGNSSNLYFLTLGGVGTNSTPVGPKSTGVGTQPTPPVGPESTRTSHSFEPVIEPVKEPVADAPSRKKAKAEKFDPLTAKPANVSATAWADWCQHRKEIRKTLTATTCARQAKTLAGHHDADAVINQSISNGWTGLFPEKVLPGAKASAQRQAGPDFYDKSWRTDTSDDL